MAVRVRIQGFPFRQCLDGFGQKTGCKQAAPACNPAAYTLTAHVDVPFRFDTPCRLRPVTESRVCFHIIEATGTCKQRHKVENVFTRLKDWRRIATCYDRCAHTFFAAVLIAAIVIYWI
ncbi:MAG: transposase [Hyphomonadaceae bacterium]|nr:transposase [Hyphomonadaceae bacterium]